MAIAFTKNYTDHSSAQGEDLIGKIDLKVQKTAVCPHCAAPSNGSKFCGSPRA